MKTIGVLISGCSILFQCSFAQAQDQYKCFLETRPLDRTPVAILSSNRTLRSVKWRLEVLKSVNSSRTVFQASVVDKGENFHSLFENKTENVSINFYTDGPDALGFMEGSMKSPVMSGNIKCLASRPLLAIK